MGFSAFTFAKNTVRCVGLLELLGMVLFTLNSFTKESGEGVHGLLNFKFTKRKVRKAVGLSPWFSSPAKAKGRVGFSNFSPSNSPMAMAARRFWARA